MSTFSRVYKPYTFRGGGGWGGGFCENQYFFHTLLTFWSDFYYVRGDFWHSINGDVYSLGGGGDLRMCLYTHETFYGPKTTDCLSTDSYYDKNEIMINS